MLRLRCLTLAWLGMGVVAPALAQPTPESVLGFAPCSDYKLASYETIADYFTALAQASERMELVEIGSTAEGRTQLMAIISSEQNLAGLDRYKEIARRLSQARGLTDEEARKLALEGKAIIWIDFGLHSNEVAHAQTAPLMAYHAVADESEEMRRIRDDVIFLLVPNMNPDGTTLVADWYMKHVGTPFENAPLPELYQKYVGHDDNRDWYMFNMPETRNVGRQLYAEWFPQIIYNQHQTGPFPARIFIPPFADPMNPDIPAEVMRGIATVGSAMSRRFEQENKPGVISRIRFDTWWNGGMRSTPYYHNMIGILTETQHNSATPADYDPDRFPKTFSNGAPTLEPSTFYPNPFRGGEWHLKDSCDYMMTASMAVLDIGSRRREEWLYGVYKMGRDAIQAGESETFVVPARQWDPGAAARMIDALRWGGIEIGRATKPFMIRDKKYRAGSYLISSAQPYRAHLRNLLTRQTYPDRRQYPDGPPIVPYDIAGWTLPMQMGVQVDRYALAVADVDLENVEWSAVPQVKKPGRAGYGYALDPRTNGAALAVNRLLKARESVLRLAAPLAGEGGEWPAGSFIVKVEGGSHDRITRIAAELGLDVRSLDTEPEGEKQRVALPRVGLYHAWGGNMDEGWTRWLLEQFEFPYAKLHDSELRAGNLKTKYDVIVLPDASYRRMLTGMPADLMPHEYTGGMTPRGVGHLFDFVESGGTIVALDSASELPIEAFGLPVSNVTEGQRQSSFFVPGSLLKVRFDPNHPLAWGMPEESAVFFARSPAFRVGRERTRWERWTGKELSAPEGVEAFACYPDENLLMSGWLLGESVLAGKDAGVEVAVGDGRVVLIGFRTQHRAQTDATFKVLFNAIYRGASTPLS